MKRTLTFFLITFILVSGCAGQTSKPATKSIDGAKKEEIIKLEPAAQPKKDIREVAWNILSAESKAEIIGGWKDGKAELVIADSSHFFLKDKSYEGKEVTLITFPSKRNAILGDVGILVDEATGKAVGGVYRD